MNLRETLWTCIWASTKKQTEGMPEGTLPPHPQADRSLANLPRKKGPAAIYINND